MSKKVVLGLFLAAVAVAACAKKEEPIVTSPVVQPEPVFKGKYGAN